MKSDFDLERRSMRFLYRGQFFTLIADLLTNRVIPIISSPLRRIFINYLLREKFKYSSLRGIFINYLLRGTFICYVKNLYK